LFGTQVSAAPVVIAYDAASTIDGKDTTKGGKIVDELKKPEEDGKDESIESPMILPLADISVTNNFKYHGEVALYYSSAGIFTAIIIYPYQVALEMINDKSDTTTDLPSKETFDFIKILLENQDSSSGLIRVVKIDGTHTIDLNGTYPENMESKLHHIWYIFLVTGQNIQVKTYDFPCPLKFCYSYMIYTLYIMFTFVITVYMH